LTAQLVSSKVDFRYIFIDEKYILRSLEYSVTNHDSPLYYPGLRIEVKADNDKHKKELFESDVYYWKLEIPQGDTVSRVVDEEDITFFNNITIYATLFYEDVDIRPYEITFTKEELGTSNDQE